MQGRDLAALEKIDENRYIKAMEEKETNDRKKEDLSNMRANNKRQGTLQALQQQMYEKEQRSRLKKMEDDSFAQIIKQQVTHGDQLDAKKKSELK